MIRMIALVGLLLSSAALAQDTHWQSRPAQPSDTAVTIEMANKTVVVIRMDGSVEFGEGFTADDAAREFWKHLGRSMPNKCEATK